MNRSRKLGLLVLLHVVVVLATPAIGTFLYLCFTLELGSSMHFGGVLAFGFGILFSYLFYGAKVLLFVFFASPVLWMLAKLKSAALAFIMAGSAGSGMGWIFGQIIMRGENQAIITNASVASAITGVWAALILEFAWRGYPPLRNQVRSTRQV